MRVCDLKVGDMYVRVSMKNAGWFVVSINDYEVMIMVLWGASSGTIINFPTSMNRMDEDFIVYRAGEKIHP
jgi:hypothetical protein